MLEKASEYFDDADLNEDSELSPAELQAFVRQLAGLSANCVRAFALFLFCSEFAFGLVFELA